MDPLSCSFSVISEHRRNFTQVRGNLWRHKFWSNKFIASKNGAILWRHNMVPFNGAILWHVYTGL